MLDTRDSDCYEVQVGKAEGTVKNHVSSLLIKLGVRDRTRAALRGLELGLVAEPR